MRCGSALKRTPRRPHPHPPTRTPLSPTLTAAAQETPAQKGTCQVLKVAVHDDGGDDGSGTAAITYVRLT